MLEGETLLTTIWFWFMLVILIVLLVTATIIASCYKTFDKPCACKANC